MVPALLLTAVAALTGVLLLCGWGALLRRTLGVAATPIEERLDDGWVGLALAIAVLQLWHLWRPIDGLCFALFVVVGAAGWVPWHAPHDMLAAARHAASRHWWAAALVTAVALLVAYRSLGFLAHYDTQLYHYPAVQWASTYAIVPGLANLHGRFGFNSAFALFAALIDRGPFEARSYHLANGILLLAALLQASAALLRVLRGRLPATLPTVYSALMLAALTTQLPNLVSLSNDVPAFLLGFVLTRYLLRLLTTTGEEAAQQDGFLWFSLAAVAGAGIALKASFALLAVPIALSAFVALVLKQDPLALAPLRRLTGIAALAAGLLLLPWVARGILLSGYPLYPSTFAGLGLPWRVPRSLVLSEAHCIRAHARQPGIFWAYVLNGWDWLAAWWTRAAQVLLRPLQVSAVALAALLVRAAVQRDPHRLRLGLHVLAPPVLALLAWFLSAPDPRFAGAAAWTLAAGAAALVLFSRARQTSRLAAWTVRLACVALLAFCARPEDLLGRPDLAGFEPFERMRVAAAHPRTTDSGDQVFVPDSGFFCTEAPLPCTPYFRRNLRYVTPGEPGGGFVLDPTLTFADMRQRSALPHGLSASADLGVCVVARGDCYSVRRHDRLEDLAAPLDLLVYSRQPVLGELSIRPRRDGPDGARLQSRAASLRVSVRGRVLMTLPLSAGETLTTTLPLSRDFTLLTVSIDDTGAPHGTPASIPLAGISLRTLAEH